MYDGIAYIYMCIYSSYSLHFLLTCSSVNNQKFEALLVSFYPVYFINRFIMSC